MRRFGSLVFLLWLGGCEPAARQPKVTTTDGEARRAIESAMARYTKFLKTGPVDSTTSLFAADGQLIEPGMATLDGPRAIADFLTPLAAQFSVDTAAMIAGEIEIYGDVAYQWGEYFQKAGPQGQEPKPYRGRYVASWVKQGGGWKIRRLLMQPAP